MASAGAGSSGAIPDQKAHVYETAIEEFKEMISSTDAATFQATTLEDVWKTAEVIEESQRRAKTAENMHRLRPFLKNLDKYSNVVKSVRHGDLYLRWIWGPVKFVLQLVNENSYAFDQLLDAYSRVGAALPQFDRPEAAMIDRSNVHFTLAVIYQVIMEFQCDVYMYFRRKADFVSLWKSEEYRMDICLKRLSSYHRRLDTMLLEEWGNNAPTSLQETLSPPDLVILSPNAVEPLYKSLSFEKAEIRLLTFPPAQKAAALKCSLMAVPLPKSPPYIALSYTWGDPTDTVPVLVNNLEVQVTVNLRNALLRLKAEGVTHIWADALCINQADSEERTAQVGRMGTIFRKASEVAVWLGCEQQIMEQPLQVFNARNIDEGIGFSLQPIFQELLSQPYWKRVWIIQEIAVASHVSVYCGNCKLGWDEFDAMCKFGVGYAVTTRNHPEDESIRGFTTVLKLRNETLARKPIKFLDAVRRSLSSESTDPRDKLYALLGLSYDGRYFIPEPNYMSSVAEAFTDFTTALIEGGEVLNFIYLRSASRKLDTDLPSWVPDWTDLDDSVARRQLDYIMDRPSLPPNKAQLNHPLKYAEIDRSSDVLAVNGVTFDTVDDLGSSFLIDDEHTSTNEAPPSETAYNASHLIFEVRAISCLYIEIDHTKYEKRLFVLPPSVSFFTGGIEYLGTLARSSANRGRFNCVIARRTPLDVQPDLTTDDDRHKEIEQIVRSELSTYKKQLIDSLLNDIPRELLPSFNAWLSQTYFFMADGSREVPWSEMLLDVEISRPRAASSMVRHFFNFMKPGMRLLRTERGSAGWVHPLAQKGDKIARIFGCSQFVVLRASDNGDHYQVVGDARLFGVKVDMVAFEKDEVQCFKIH